MKPPDTQNLTFRQLVFSDATDLFEGAFAHNTITKYLQWDFHNSILETEILINEMLEFQNSLKKYFWIAEHKSNKRSIALCSLTPCENSAWIGFITFKDELRKGYATELISAIEAMSRSQFKHLSASVHPSNTASSALLKKAGWHKYDADSEFDLHIYRKKLS